MPSLRGTAAPLQLSLGRAQPLWIILVSFASGSMVFSNLIGRIFLIKDITALGEGNPVILILLLDGVFFGEQAY